MIVFFLLFLLILCGTSRDSEIDWHHGIGIYVQNMEMILGLSYADYTT